MAEPNNFKIANVTPADTDLPYLTVAVAIGAAGTLIVTDSAGTVTTIASGTLAAGIFHPLNVKRIAAASTATGITVQYANP